MIGRLRLFSGLVLFIYVLGHFYNHALGIVSLRAMNDALSYTIAPWRTNIGTAIMLSALAIHSVLASYALYKRRSFRMKLWEVSQIVLGFLIPILLAGHVLSTRGIYEVYDIEKAYSFFLYGLWVESPMRGIMLGLTLLVVWIHACIGWHYWLRLKPWYQRVKTIAFALAILVPALALVGYISAGFRILRLAKSEKWVAAQFKNIETEPQVLENFISINEQRTQIAVVCLVLILLAIQFGRSFFSGRSNSGKITYRSLDLNISKQLNIAPNNTVLDHIISANIPHASICGGRGRCSTCRIRIDSGLETLTPPSETESKVLTRISAAPNVRLACQLKTNQPLNVTALLSPDATAREGFPNTNNLDGSEQEVAVLFADIRAFTKLSESKLPYDVSFLLNRYFAAMGNAIEQSGGHVDKFIGDGVMALFGLNKSIEEGCTDAINATQKMSERLNELNQSLADDLDEPLRIGIGVHSGTAIVGRMGYNKASSLTAIGDVVNTASRLESLTKEFGAQIIISEKTVSKSGSNLANSEQHKVSVRGRKEPLSVHVIK